MYCIIYLSLKQKKYENNITIDKNNVDRRSGAKFAMERFSMLACLSLENVTRFEFSSELVQIMCEERGCWNFCHHDHLVI